MRVAHTDRPGWARHCLRALLLLACAFALVACSARVDLLGAVPEDEANEVLAALLKADIDAGKTAGKEGMVGVQVSGLQVAQALQVLRDNGLPRERFAGMGQIFKKEGLISSPLEERARYIYALSQELSSTLSQIDGVLGAGVLGCVGGGWLAPRFGSARVAGVQLAISGLCCVLAPVLIGAPDALFYGWLLVWGITVSGDSPQFSTLTARNAPPQAVGSVLTLTNSIGFAISIASILLFVEVTRTVPLGWLLTGLALGPALGLWALRPLLRERA